MASTFSECFRLYSKTLSALSRLDEQENCFVAYAKKAKTSREGDAFELHPWPAAQDRVWCALTGRTSATVEHF